jgi:hypothetical protein
MKNQTFEKSLVKSLSRILYHVGLLHSRRDQKTQNGKITFQAQWQS